MTDAEKQAAELLRRRTTRPLSPDQALDLVREIRMILCPEEAFAHLVGSYGRDLLSTCRKVRS